ncbi:MAG: S8 family serine peptidase, partial [Phycisphaerales bacterium]
MNRSHGCVLVYVIVILVCAGYTTGSDLCVTQNDTNTELSFHGNEPFRITESDVTDARLVQVPGTEVLLALWNEAEPGRDAVPFYAISLDGMDVKWVRRTSYDLDLKYARFDPLDQAPQVEEALTADSANELYMVQFVTQPLSVFRNTVAGLGADIYGFISNHAYIMRLSGETKAQVEALPFVRTVLPYHPAYRLERYLRENLDRADELFPLQRYDIMVFERGVAQKTVVADRIRAMGGTVDVLSRSGFLFQATLTPEQLLEVIRYNEFRFIGRHRPAAPFMDVARDIGGGNYVEAVGGYTGQGVIGEVLDEWNPETTHQALTGRCAGGSSPGAPCANDDECPGGICERAPIPHHPNIWPSMSDHATVVFGIVFGDGTGAPPDPDHEGLPLAKGMLPEGQGIFGDYCRLPQFSWLSMCQPLQPLVERECFTCELTCSDCEAECEEACGAGQVDSSAPYRAVFQSNSWGSSSSEGYNGWSFQVDDILFRYDVLTCHALGNYGKSEPPSAGTQGWAKNVVTVGGVYHYNSENRADHEWEHWDESEGCASYGLAPDGRIKPDFTHFYDQVLAPRMGNEYGPFFWGTSVAAPIVSGHFGLFFQMWSD